MTDISCWAIDTPISDDGFFPPLAYRSTYGLGERPINPQTDMHQLFDWQDSTIRERGFVMLLHNTTAAVVITTLGFMTFGVRHEQDSGKAGTENFGDFLKWEG